MSAPELTLDRRQEIFLALVYAQDQDGKVNQARRHIAERFGLSEEALQRIEQEGMDNDWPPLV